MSLEISTFDVYLKQEQRAAGLFLAVTSALWTEATGGTSSYAWDHRRVDDGTETAS